jgi:glucose-1-phosphate cytidylyltransferase
MKVVILAGGMGTRLSEETHLKPKPMIEIGGKPILWHIMKTYSHYGFNEFIICLGYKGYLIKEYFANYFLHQSDVTFDLQDNRMQIHNNYCESWKVTLVNTGESTLTGGRLKRVHNYLDEEPFCFTYGDGVADINIRELVEFHNNQGLQATLTAVQPPGRFGAIDVADSKVIRFKEKPQGDKSWINGGFFVLSPSVLSLIEGDHTSWESTPLEALAQNGQLASFQHNGFFLPMDTIRDKNKLEELWDSGQAPWKVW